MKRLIALLTLAAITASPLAGFTQADIKNDPAYLPIDKVLDLKATPPQVDVNLPGFLLKDALSGLNSTNLGESRRDMTGLSKTDLADLVKDVKLIRVLVFEGTKSNRAALAKSIKPLRDELDDKWTSLVRVKDEGDNVGVYVKGDATGDSVAGLAVLVHDGDDGDTVIVNVVGHVSLGKLMKFASQSGKLSPELFKQLSAAGVMPSAEANAVSAAVASQMNKTNGDVGYGVGYGGPKAGTAATSQMNKTDNDAGTNKPLEAPKTAAKDSATK
jgi:hypothetical protein